jgi:uncharacterized protein
VSGFLNRHALSGILEALRHTPVIVVLGARKVGKSTMVERITKPSEVLSLDDQATRQAAQDDPTGFIEDLVTPVVIDEVQHAPDLLIAIKQRVDRDPRPGQFLLTSSTNILMAPKIADTLTSRAEYYGLWPFTQGELWCTQEQFIETLFRGAFPQMTGAMIGRKAHASTLVTGGFPETQQHAARRRLLFFENYLDTLIESDLSSIARVHNQSNTRRLLNALASTSSSLLNYDGLSRDLGVPTSTLRSHTDLLEALFLIRRVAPWHHSLLSRALKTPKSYITDSGLLAHLLGADETRIEHDDTISGMLFKSFVAMELLRQAEWQPEPVKLSHYRDKDGREVDLILERRDGTVIGVHVKAAASVKPSDFRGLRRIRDALGDKFKAGALIYTGANTLPTDDRLTAIPIEGLWTGT